MHVPGNDEKDVDDDVGASYGRAVSASGKLITIAEKVKAHTRCAHPRPHGQCRTRLEEHSPR
jgi:hypothetical protein